MVRLLALLTVVLASGCKIFFPVPSTMASAFDPLPPPKQAKCLMVLLPGAGDTAETFREKGFVEAIQGSGARVDVVAANATLGYYLRGTAAERIEIDVVAPLRTRGYEQIWVLGISMGGFGAFHYTQFFPEHVDGILALAPYLGDLSLGREIRDAGGLAKWTPDPPAPIVEDNYQRQLWSWLHNVTTGKQPGPQIYLGYGDQDGLGAQDALLAQALPPDHVFHAPGGHDWGPWRALLLQFLRSSEFQRRCAP
jgi:pimeloyl-ACP methyl ester carboxylesterase